MRTLPHSDLIGNATPAVGVAFRDYYQAAIVARACGFCVFPLGDNKKSLGRWKQWQTRRPTDRELARMFVGNTRVGGLAVVLGAISGFRAKKTGQQAVLACRDFDTVESYQRWAEHRPELAAKLLTVRTRRGFHIYCRLWGDERFVKLPDGDLRADAKHYAVLPPSRHPLGGHYRWLANEPVGFGGIPVLTLAESGFLDGYTVRTKSTALSLPSPTRSPASAAVPPATRNSHQSPKNQTHGLCATPQPDRASPRLALPIREAVLRTVPARPGERNGKLLSLARALVDIAPGVRADYWRDAVREWHRLALPVVRTKDYAETWRDFAHAWSRAEKPMSASRPKAAFVAGVTSAEGQPDPVRLLAGCRGLAAEVGPVFALAGRDAASAMGIPPRTAARLLARLVKDGSLVVVRRGEPSATKRIATYYRLGTSSSRDTEGEAQ